ncbi:MAG: beta-eliminating lyase-related protein, partial [Pseudomonadota bacterium]
AVTIWLTSDNAGPAAPEVMAAVAAANEGYAGSYGADPWSERATALVREQFEAPEAVVHLAATGTAANSLALACLAQPWQAIFCHAHAHVEEDEQGGPTFYSGAKLALVEGAHAKIDPEALAPAMATAAGASVHNVQVGPLSITQATELGAVYSPQDVAALAGIAKKHGVGVHMDGTRFANAVARLGCSPAELSWKAGVDVLCLGATKNGAMAAEAVIFFDGDKARAWEFELRRKRGGHLFSKMRYVAAQMAGWLEDGLWLRLAAQANAQADRLAEGLRASGVAELPHPVDANMVFPSMTRATHRTLTEAGVKHYPSPPGPWTEGPDDEVLPSRMVCNWATRDEEVDAVLAALPG